jgi:hypothetical protein
MTGDLGERGLDRPLGFTEALCARWHEAIPHGLQVVAAALCTRAVTRAELAEAVERIGVRHPGAASGIVVDAEGRQRFVPSDPNAVVVAEAPAGSRWRDRFADQLVSRLDLDRALWRVELVASPADADVPAVVIVSGCHALLDGVSATVVLCELLQPADDRGPGRRLPAMEDLLPARAPTAAPGRSPEADRWPVARRAAAPDRTFGFTDRTVAADTVAALQRRAHQEQTTIGALLGVACTRARATVPGAGDHAGFNVPFDVRPRVSPRLPADAVGAYFGRAHVYSSGVECDAEPWRAARRLSSDLHDELAAMVQPPTWDDSTIDALLADLVRDDRDRFDLSVLLTDLGVRDLGPVSACFVTTVQTTGVEAFVVSAVSPAGGDLCLGFGWPRPLVDDEVARAYADAVVDQLAELARV